MNDKGRGETARPEPGRTPAGKRASERREARARKRERFLNLLTHYKPLLEFAGITVVVVALILNLVAIDQTRRAIALQAESVRQSAQALEMQRREFRLRTRPIVVVKALSLAGPPPVITGEPRLHSVLIELACVSGTPAVDVTCHTEFYVDGARVGPHGFIEFGMIPQGRKAVSGIGIIDSVYACMTNTDKTVYGSMLKEGDAAYTNIFAGQFSPEQRLFKGYELAAWEGL